MGRKQIDNPRTESVHVRFSEKELQVVMDFLNDSDQFKTVAPLIRKAIMEYIKDREKRS